MAVDQEADHLHQEVVEEEEKSLEAESWEKDVASFAMRKVIWRSTALNTEAAEATEVVVEEIPDLDQEVAVDETLADVEEATLPPLLVIARGLAAEATAEATLREEIEEPQLTTKPDTEGT